MQIEMTIKGLMVDPITNTPIILLHDEAGQRVLPIWVGLFEANAIALQIGGVVRRIVISDLQESTFFALLHLETAAGPVVIDARPSDAIALALRCKAPILVEDTVLDHAKTIDFGVDRPDTERLQKWLESLDPEELGKYKM
jgi:bifunctional DNase/RNase